MVGKPLVVLAIGGSDSGAGAGIQADLRTFGAFGVWGTVAVTAVTAQNTLGVHDVALVAPQSVKAQIDAIATDMRVAAVKTGMLATAETVRVVADALARYALAPVVVDPVLAASAGGQLLEPAALAVLRDYLLPLCAVFTPNIPEAEALLGGERVRSRDEMVDAAVALADWGPAAVLLKGGHLESAESPDLLWYEGTAQWFEGPRLDGGCHGTGCTLSAAIAAQLAQGLGVPEACRRAKAFVVDAVRGGVAIGAGPPVVCPGLGRDARAEIRSSQKGSEPTQDA